MAMTTIQQLLTTAEEEVMLKLWELKKAAVVELIPLYTNPRPAYNTVSTFIRILEKKGMVGHEKKRRGFLYFPLITIEEYRKHLLERLLINYYKNDIQAVNSEINQMKKLDQLL
jgi:predicted transcriptional regulator